MTAEELLQKARRLVAEGKAVSMSEAKRRVVQTSTRDELQVRPTDIRRPTPK